MKNNDFEYKYSAPTSDERREIESIRNSYISKNNDTCKLEYLRKLDRKVRNTPTIISLIIGILGTLTFGLGLSMILEWEILVGGIIVSLVGCVLAFIGYPVYLVISKHMKNKYTDKILKLTEELLNDD